jgi:hypothetical protein
MGFILGKKLVLTYPSRRRRLTCHCKGRQQAPIALYDLVYFEPDKCIVSRNISRPRSNTL